jgi:hypothetical protein
MDIRTGKIDLNDVVLINRILQLTDKEKERAIENCNNILRSHSSSSSCRNYEMRDLEAIIDGAWNPYQRTW